MRIEKSRIINNEKEALDFYLLMVEATKDGSKTIEEIDGWYELVDIEEPPVEPISIEETYSQMVVKLIRERYSQDDESAIVRKKLAGIDIRDEFVEYNAYCEQCKQEARARINELEG